jgi:hypothetical protein
MEFTLGGNTSHGPWYATHYCYAFSERPFMRPISMRHTIAVFGVLAACTACSASFPTTPVTSQGAGTPAANNQQGGQQGGQGGQQNGGSSGCVLDSVSSIAGESSGQLASQTSGWGELDSNGWTVPVPDGSWTADGSSAGFDAQSTSGADVSVGDSFSQSQITISQMESTAFAQVSNMSVVCQTAVASSSTGSTQGTEYTGVYQGENIHGILVTSVLAPSTSDLWVGDTHSVYTPAADWSESTAQTLFLIAFEAIGTPQDPDD